MYQTFTPREDDNNAAMRPSREFDIARISPEGFITIFASNCGPGIAGTVGRDIARRGEGVYVTRRVGTLEWVIVE